MQACVCIVYALLGIDAIEDEIYADKCKVALTNVLESILASWYPACLIYTVSLRQRESERTSRSKKSNDCLFASMQLRAN